MNLDNYDHTYAANFRVPENGWKRCKSNTESPLKHSFRRHRNGPSTSILAELVVPQNTIEFIHHDHNYHESSPKVSAVHSSRRNAATSLLYPRNVYRLKRCINNYQDNCSSLLSSSYAVVDEPAKPEVPPPPDPILSQEEYLFGFNLISCKGNTAINSCPPCKTFDTNSMYSMSITDPIVLNAISRRRAAIIVDPEKEFHKTQMKVKNAETFQLKLRTRERACKVNGTKVTASTFTRIASGYPKLKMRPVVELERLLKIHCVRCARTSYFACNKCYPRCRHLELLREFVRTPSPSSIHRLSSKTIQRCQMQGELYFFYDA